MKKFVFIFSLILLVSGLAAAQSKGSTLYVAVKTLTLKASTDMFATNNKGTLKYGDKVTVLQVKDKGKYVEVQSITDPKITGWTTYVNFSSKQIVSGTTSTASAKEMALAGKGFSQQAENDLKKQKGNLNYADVDKTESITVREKDIKKFMEEGKLKMGGK